MLRSVYTALDDCPEYLLAVLDGIVSERAMKRYKHAVNKQKGRSIILGEVLVRYIASQCVNKDWYDLHLDHFQGKPMLLNSSDLYISLSHSDNYIFATASNRPVGCDIQTPKNIHLEFAKGFFSGEDFHVITNSENPQKDFLRIWTRRESFFKAVNPQEALSHFVFNNTEAIKNEYDIFFYSWLIDSGQAMATVAVQGDEEEPSMQKLPFSYLIEIIQAAQTKNR